MFQSLEHKKGGKVGFGGDQKGRIIGKGTVGTNTSTSITNVLLVDGLMHNLLSISQICDKGYDIIFNQSSCKVINQNDKSILFQGYRVDNIYKIDLNDLKNQKVKCLMSVNEE